jgi:hypothetical protein
MVMLLLSSVYSKSTAKSQNNWQHKVRLRRTRSLAKVRMELFFHFHQFVIEVLRKIGSIGIADIDEPVNEIAD